MRHSIIPIFFLLTSLLTQSAQGQDYNSRKDSSNVQMWTKMQLKFSYPKKAVESKVEGNVVVSFDIDSTCSIVNVKLVKGIGYGCDEEAIRAVKNMKLTFHKEQQGKCTSRYNILQTINFIYNDE